MSRAPSPKPSRRDVLRWSLSGAMAVGAGACSSSSAGRGTDPATGRPPAPDSPGSSPRPGDRSPVPVDERRLVIIQLLGGNDGLSVMAPLEDGRYRDARPTLAHDAEDLIDLGGGYGLHRSFSPLHDAGLTLLAGVGDPQANLSHFDMQDRWWHGTPGASFSSQRGFVGRLADELADGQRIAGVSLGQTLAAGAVDGSKWATSLSASRISMTDGFRHPPIVQAPPPGGDLARAYRDLARSGGPGGPLSAAYRHSFTSALDFEETLRTVGAPTDYGVQGNACQFADHLAFVAQLFASDVGVRVAHVGTWGPIFDTHYQHRRNFFQAWEHVMPGLVAFRSELQRLGLADKVLIVTTSEFGRRLGEKDAGLDHGSASCALVMGPSQAGVVGEHPRLDRLDDTGSPRPTVSFDRYYATLAAWLGIDPAAVLDRPARPIAELVAV